MELRDILIQFTCLTFLFQCFYVIQFTCKYVYSLLSVLLSGGYQFIVILTFIEQL